MNWFFQFILRHEEFLKRLLVAAVIFGVTYVVYRPLIRAVRKMLDKLTARFKSDLPGLLLDALEKPARGLVLFIGFAWAFSFLNPAVSLRVFRLGVIVLITWGFVRFISPETLSIGLFARSQGTMSKTFCIFFSKVLKLVVASFGMIIFISEFGIQVGGLITGLGLGGLTVALAAQDWASNLFGGMVILFDHPFEVDDWIEVDANPDLEGVVEDMTFRTTRIRTFDNSQIIVPNSLIVGKPVINWSRMQKRKISFDLDFTYQSPPEALNQFAERIREILRNTPEAEQDLIVVTFHEFADSSLRFRVHFFTRLTGYADYMAVKESINYQILQTAAECGLEFAFPTRSVYLENQ